MKPFCPSLRRRSSEKSRRLTETRWKLKGEKRGRKEVLWSCGVTGGSGVEVLRGCMDVQERVESTLFTLRLQPLHNSCSA